MVNGNSKQSVNYCQFIRFINQRHPDTCVISSLEFNGISIIYTSCWSSPDEVFVTDACLTGCGGCSGSKMFHKEFPADVLVRFPFIHQLECLAMLVAVCLWGSAWKGQRLTVFCDNIAVVQVLNSGKTGDALLGKLTVTQHLAGVFHS